MAFLQNISSNLPAMKMDGLKFSDFFVWLSNSMSNVTKSQPGQAVSTTEILGAEAPSWLQGAGATIM